MSKESRSSPRAWLALQAHLALASVRPKTQKNHASPAGYWWMCKYSTLIWMLRLLINPACSNATQWLICIQMNDFVYQCSIDPLFQITQLRGHSTFLHKQSVEQWHSQRIRSTFLLYRNCFPFCFDVIRFTRKWFPDYVSKTGFEKRTAQRRKTNIPNLNQNWFIVSCQAVDNVLIYRVELHFTLNSCN